jgi:hypothetical protein
MDPAAGAPSASGAPNMTTSPPPIVRGEPVQVADGVFVIPDNRIELVPNVGIVLGDRAALVVEAASVRAMAPTCWTRRGGWRVTASCT